MIRILTIAVFLYSISLGQQGFADAFQSFGTSARMAGLGQAVVADFGHDASYIVNPSASSSLSGTNGYALYINQFGMAEYGALGFSKTTQNSWRWGLHGIGVFIDNILERPDLRTITDLEIRRDSIRTLVAQGFTSFSDLESSLTFNLAKEFNYDLDLGWQMEIIPLRIPVGINIHLMHKNLHDIQGSGIGIDVGTMVITNLKKVFFFDWMGDFAFGLTGKHLFGSRIFWNTERQDLIPMHVIWGWSYRQSMPWAGTELRVFRQRNTLYSGEANIGLEALIKSRVILQAGYRAESFQGNIEINLAGLLFPGKIGYGFSDHELGMVHRLGVEFGI